MTTSSDPANTVDGLIFASPQGQTLPTELVLHVFDILEARHACGSLAAIQTCSTAMYRGVSPFLYRHLYLLPTSFERLFRHLDLTLHSQSAMPEDEAQELLLPPVDINDHKVEWMELPKLLRFRSLFTLVRQITLTFDMTRSDLTPAVRKVTGALVRYYQTRLEMEGQILFPDVKRIQFLGSRSNILKLGTLATTLVLGSCARHLCFKSVLLDESFTELLQCMKESPDTIIFHQAKPVAVLKLAGRYTIRASFEHPAGPEYDGFSTIQGVSNYIEHITTKGAPDISPHGDGTTTKKQCRIVARRAKFTGNDGHNEGCLDEEMLQTVRDTLDPCLYRFLTGGPPPQDASRNREAASITDGITMITNDEAVHEPPCEICGERL
ncbi:uncharacterized protein I303_104391 [Kwoniella dejecticola CBS 10117]|uniref:F-box domain-containing protein n=1 Tax=Kwoniella dejecticola CBS 10117 TaxID=1296121 RepID=A0A1A6A5G0_9TREE|nr:uncharacterized protein I303_04631 [Kwoniella dejecticola CBS 10117]OBR85297.1 hypothetical protein I303_04631 [Kwoniella dejecticola CBS 10117]